MDARCVLSRFRCVQLFVTRWTVAHQAPLSTGFSRQEYWNGLPFLPPGDLPDPGIKPVSLVSPALAGGFFTTSTTCEAQSPYVYTLKQPLSALVNLWIPSPPYNPPYCNPDRTQRGSE